LPVARVTSALLFHHQHDIRSIVRNLIENMGQCKDWDNPRYYKSQVFKALAESSYSGAMGAVAR